MLGEGLYVVECWVVYCVYLYTALRRALSTKGELAQLVERSLCMRKVVDSISAFSITFLYSLAHCTRTRGSVLYRLHIPERIDEVSLLVNHIFISLFCQLTILHVTNPK